MSEKMIEKFRIKLLKEKKTQTWFHREFIRHIPGKTIQYGYFGMMLTGASKMKPAVEAAIQNFVDGE